MSKAGMCLVSRYAMNMETGDTDVWPEQLHNAAINYTTLYLKKTLIMGEGPIF